MLNRLTSYLYVPYQLLQILGYRLAGKRCAYRWRDYGVKPRGPVSRKQLLIGGLFPVAVFFMLILLQASLYIYLHYRYHLGQPWLPFAFGILSSLCLGAYFYLVIFDVLRVRRLLKETSKFDSKIKKPSRSHKKQG